MWHFLLKNLSSYLTKTGSALKVFSKTFWWIVDTTLGLSFPSSLCVVIIIYPSYCKSRNMSRKRENEMHLTSDKSF